MNEMGTITLCDGSRYDEIREAAKRRRRAQTEARRTAERKQKEEQSNG